MYLIGRRKYPIVNMSESNSKELEKVIWQCVTATKKGKKFCKHSKGIPETAIEEPLQLKIVTLERQKIH